MNKADLFLHPIRMRIGIELSGRSMTTATLSKRLSDVPKASLYRHIKVLVDSGMVQVVGEKVVNGATERTYAMPKGPHRLTDADFRKATAKDHLRYFSIFAATLVNTFSRYISKAAVSRVIEEGLSYNTAVVYLTDDERDRFRREVAAVVERVIHTQPGPGRRRYSLSSVVIPENAENHE